MVVASRHGSVELEVVQCQHFTQVQVLVGGSLKELTLQTEFRVPAGTVCYEVSQVTHPGDVVFLASKDGRGTTLKTVSLDLHHVPAHLIRELKDHQVPNPRRAIMLVRSHAVRPHEFSPGNNLTPP